MLAQLVIAGASELFHESVKPAIVEEALALYQYLSHTRRTRGRDLFCAALASLYAAARYRGVPIEPVEFLVLAEGCLRRLAASGRINGRLASRIRGARPPLWRRWKRGFYSLWRVIVLEVYGRSPPPVMPADLARTYASWLASVRGGPEGLGEVAEKAAAALSHRAEGRAARRVALAGVVAASRLLGSPVTAEELAGLLGHELVGRSRQTLESLEELAREALALLREDREPRVVPEEAGEV